MEQITHVARFLARGIKVRMLKRRRSSSPTSGPGLTTLCKSANSKSSIKLSVEAKPAKKEAEVRFIFIDRNIMNRI